MIRNVEQRLEMEEENAKHLSRPFLTKVDIRLGVPCPVAVKYPLEISTKLIKGIESWLHISGSIKRRDECMKHISYSSL